MRNVTRNEEKQEDQLLHTLFRMLWKMRHNIDGIRSIYWLTRVADYKLHILRYRRIMKWLDTL